MIYILYLQKLVCLSVVCMCEVEPRKTHHRASATERTEKITELSKGT